MGYFLKALQVMAIVSEWSVTALQDGKITVIEAGDLVQKLGLVLGVKVELDLNG